MAIVAKYTAPIQVVLDPDMRRRIKQISDDEGISMAQVVRDLADHGIAWREQVSADKV